MLTAEAVVQAVDEPQTACRPSSQRSNDSERGKVQQCWQSAASTCSGGVADNTLEALGISTRQWLSEVQCRRVAECCRQPRVV